MRAHSTNHSDAIQKALLVAAVIAYARPFKTSETSDSSTPHLPGAALKDFTPEEREYHGRLLRVRDEAIAHSAYERKAVRRASGSDSGFVTMGRMFDVRAEIESVSLFLGMVLKLITYCRTSMFALNRQLTEHAFRGRCS